MSKKYVPSGYQIIDLELEFDGETTIQITPETEDEKILFDLLNSDENTPIKKPILLTIKSDKSPKVLTGYVTILQSTLKICRLADLIVFNGDGVGGYQFTIRIDDGKLNIEYSLVEF